jgi:hypothetical protein
MTDPLMPDVTTELLGGFSPYLHDLHFDFSANALELQLLDQIDQPSRVRVLRFERVKELRVTSHDAEDTDRNFIEGIIGAHRRGDEYHFHTDRQAISFSCADVMHTERGLRDEKDALST